MHASLPASFVRVLALGMLVLMFATGCASTMRPQDFAGRQPRFEPEKFFAGRTKSWGVVENRFGKVQKQFTADVRGTTRGNELVLDQRFRFSDGTTQQRTWKIRRVDQHRYVGTASDVRGKARGEAYGNALSWDYTLMIPMGRGTTDVRFAQLFLLQEPDVLFNRVEFSKFGVRLGTVTEFFQKVR